MSVRKFTVIALVIYVFLGAIDFIDTFVLIQHSGGEVYESNPLAATWLKEYGWQGLAIFKALTIGIVITAVLVIRKRNPQIAAVIASAGCLSVLAVAVYSRQLLTAMSTPAG